MKKKKASERAWRSITQVEAGEDAYQLDDGKVITYEQFEKLKAMMPNSKWIVFIWASLPTK